MTVVDGHVKLTPRSNKREAHLPIDTFFTSLAEIHKEDAIGVVLSGSAHDGTKGLLAIKAAGGLTFAQDESAKFDSMPKSAITAGAVDFVLSPKGIAEELIRISKVDYIKSDEDNPTEKESIVNMVNYMKNNNPPESTNPSNVYRPQFSHISMAYNRKKKQNTA